jgi:hypothetical protein
MDENSLSTHETDEHDLSTHEMERDFFQGAQPVTVSVELLGETLEEAREVFAANGWTEAEGLRIVMTAGIGKLKTAPTLSDDDLASPDTVKGLSDRMMQLESLYAVMKYRAFHLMKDNQTLEIQNNALRNTIRAMEGQVQGLQEEILTLKARSGETKRRIIPGLVERAPTQLSEVADAPARPTLLDKIRRRLG